MLLILHEKSCLQSQRCTEFLPGLPNGIVFHFKKGINKILEKVGEEGVETIIAAKDYAAQNTESNLNDLIYETADLWFHSIVMLGYFDLNPQLIIDELARRQGLSGLVEKANRNKV